MAFGRKKKKESSSRYDRMKDGFSDNEEQLSLRAGVEIPDPGYGVRDSYSRQNAYWDSAEDSLFERRSGSYGDPAAGYRAGGKKPASPESKEDWYRAGYNAGYRDRARGEKSFKDPYPGDSRFMEDDPEYDIRDEVMEDGPAAAAGGRPRRHEGRARKKKKGFWWKIILLVLAAAALFLVWRFSRMDRMYLKDIATNEGVVSDSGYQTFVIYGVDSREGKLTEETHSDTIILCSLNKKSKEIRLVSVYRDTYLDNTNGEYRKAAECYYFGGPSRSINMLNKNLDLNIRDYVTVDFNALIKAVDLVGGVYIDVTAEELPYINGYQTENAEVTGAEITPVESAGYQLLNGIQALAYCRIRYTAGSDYKRTERQRTVISQIFDSVRRQGVTAAAQLVDTLLPMISTSFSNTELLSLASSAAGCSLGESVGFPFELQAANISAGDCVVPVNLANNVSQLHAFLFGTEGYTPTATVQQISDEIAYSTGIYG